MCDSVFHTREPDLLFVDLFPLGAAATDGALEYIFKSTHDNDDGIWAPHESVYIRRLIELFTRRGLDRLRAVQEAVLAWSTGRNHRKNALRSASLPDMMTRWTSAELAQVKTYLESLPPSQWTIDDHMIAVEYVLQRYLPESELVTEAEWLAVRASLMGKVQANLAGSTSSGHADRLLATLPSTVASATNAFGLSILEKSVLRFATVHAAEHVRSLTEKVRHALRSVVARYFEEKEFSLQYIGSHSLETRLVDAFAVLNRDWRTIAVTEAGECQVQGFIAALQPGSKVRRIERYTNACAFCRKIDGKVMTVVSPDVPAKDGETQIWVGKTNVGRSASPKKRKDNLLVDRHPDEVWWVAAGLQHPNCRGRWVLVESPEEEGDPGFTQWLVHVLGE